MHNHGTVLMDSLKDLSILLVEDEYLIALDASEMLAEMGASNVRVASSVDEALKCVASDSYNLAVLDVNLDGQLSVPVAQVLKDNGTPFLFTTGYSLKHRPLPGFENSISVSKPYTAEKLREGLAAALKTQPSKP